MIANPPTQSAKWEPSIITRLLKLTSKRKESHPTFWSPNSLITTHSIKIRESQKSKFRQFLIKREKKHNYVSISVPQILMTQNKSKWKGKEKLFIIQYMDRHPNPFNKTTAYRNLKVEPKKNYINKTQLGLRNFFGKKFFIKKLKEIFFLFEKDVKNVWLKLLGRKIERYDSENIFKFYF